MDKSNVRLVGGADRRAVTSPELESRGWRHAAPLILLGVIVLLVLGSRLWQARDSLWLDELHTAWSAMGSWGEVSQRAAQGNQSPLFFQLLWVLVRGLGASEWVLRLPSLVSGTLLPVALYFVTRRWTGSAWLGLLPAWLAAVDAQTIYFGTEARPYALIQLVAVLHVFHFARLVERPTLARRAVFVGGLLLLFHLHYTAVLLVVAELAFFAIDRGLRRRDGRYSWAAVGVDLTVFAILSLGALGGLQSVYLRRGNWAAFVEQRSWWQATAVIPWASFAVVTIAVAALGRWRRTEPEGVHGRGDGLTESLLPFLWLFVPVLLTWIVTATDLARLLHPRYVAASAPAALVLTAIALRAVPWRSFAVAVSIILSIAAPWMSQLPQELRTSGRLIAWRTDDWRSAVRYFNGLPGHELGPVLVRTTLLESDGLRLGSDARLADYCLLPVTSLYPIDARRDRLIALSRSNAWRLPAIELQLLRASNGFWLISSGSSASADEIARELARSMERASRGDAATGATAWAVASQASFGSVRVTRIEPSTTQ